MPSPRTRSPGRGPSEAPKASVVIPAVFETVQNAIESTIQPIGCTIHCEYSVYRMIFRPRVAPMYVNASAANGTVSAAARNAGSDTSGTAVNRSASHRADRYATTANGSDTDSAIATERRTSPRARIT